jgi:uncharacterized membrane protein YgdD (TMEM256/DUF423 family)
MVLAAMIAHLTIAGGTATAAGHLADIALRYHLLHAVALVALAGAAAAVGGRWPWWIAGCWIGGTLFFSGGLYLQAFTGVTALGPIVPVGGTLFILGWVLVAVFGIVLAVRAGRR